MKKLLMLILIGLLVVLSIFIVIQGVQIGNLGILGITQIQAKNSQLDLTIQKAGKLVQKDYVQAVSEVETNAKKLKEEKKAYEEMTIISTEGEIQASNKIEKYEIETLWVRLGNHATSEGVVMQMDVIKGNNSLEDMYDLKFTATGSYISISDFIYAIENDSTLGFKIEEFKMIPSESANDLKATFVCKDIAIKGVLENVSTQLDTDKTDDTTNNTSTNATNSTTNVDK